MIKIKSVTTATTVGVDLASLMATDNANQQQLITVFSNMSNNRQRDAPSNGTIKTKTKTNDAVIGYYRQWSKYCYKCGVHLNYNSKDYPYKTAGHKDDTSFVDKKGRNDKCDYFWNLWCELVTDQKVAVLSVGVKTKS